MAKGIVDVLETVQVQKQKRDVSVAAVGLVAWHYDADFYRATAQTGRGVETWQFDPEFLRLFTRPKLFVGGEHDSFAPPAVLQALVARLPPSKILHQLPGTDHFFGGREREVGALVARCLTD